MLLVIILRNLSIDGVNTEVIANSITKFQPIIIKNIECINKSYVGFLKDMKNIGLEFEETNNTSTYEYSIKKQKTCVLIGKKLDKQIENKLREYSKVVLVTEPNIPDDILNNIKQNIKTKVFTYVFDVTGEKIKEITCNSDINIKALKHFFNIVFRNAHHGRSAMRTVVWIIKFHKFFNKFPGFIV